MKSAKTPCIFYTDLKYLIKVIDNCKNNPEKFSATKKLNLFLMNI